MLHFAVRTSYFGEFILILALFILDRTRTASQSSHHDNYRPASQAIDGDPNTIAHTAQRPEVPNPWWKLEYECAQTFNAVAVTNRRDCCCK